MNLKGFAFATKLGLIGLLVFASSCAVNRQYAPANEALILVDGTQIPCRISEITDQEIIFRALNAKDAYQYGNHMPLGQIEWIQVARNGRAIFLTVDEYLKMHADQFEKVVENEPERSGEVQKPAPNVPEPSTVNETREVKPAQKAAGQKPEQPPATQTSTTPEGPGLRLQSVLADTLPYRGFRSGLGLRLPVPPAPPSLIPAADFANLADFIVASGAAGLVLYRAEKFAAEGIKLSKPRQKLIDAIRASKMWRARKEGLREAHRIAAAEFKARYKELAAEMQRTLGFRASRKADPFVQFVIYLHTHGNLSSRTQRNRIRVWFGQEAQQALVDILANFDDWYYVAVISARSLKL
ncbi:MAG: hypothetical protein D6814_09940 [Calditrichaeota bacterium]|nr:MAG: hypothetical protein D6814_09940 [Calditrichota bacterium]